MKKLKAIVMILSIMFTTLVYPVQTEAASSVVENAISWAVSIANDNSHGYSMSSRWGPDYDCSSFVISAFRSAGVNTGTATYTGNMKSQFTQHGFQWIPWSQIGSMSNLQRGDILLNEATHTEIYLGNGKNVGAHSNRGYPQTGDQTGTEVSVSGYYYHPWDGVLRYTSSDVCTCSADYAGDYTVNTSSLPLSLRSGHGTGYSVIASIPKGSTVFVSRSDGTWAHVQWGGYSGYCSMSYLKKIETQSKNFNLHVWVSDTEMGGVPSQFIKEKKYYICYELIDLSTGKRANETGNINYKATEVIRSSSGQSFEHTYDNSDYNWIAAVCHKEDTYTGTVTITGDISVSCSVSFETWADVGPQIKIWSWEGDDSNEVTTMKAGKTAYYSYLIRDKNTGDNLNSVTTRYIGGSGYSVKLSVYNPDGSLLKSQTFKNNDSVWISFVPSVIGDYKIVSDVSGTLTGRVEKTISATEVEHVFGNWVTIKSPTCTTEGVKNRTCSVCKKVETASIPKIAHSYGSWTVTRNATCTETGSKKRSCSACGSTQTQILSMKEHSMGEWVVTKKATCSSSGMKTRVCSACGFGESQVIGTNNHLIVKEPSVPASYVGDGKTGCSYCKICKQVIEESKIIPRLRLKSPMLQTRVNKKTATIKYSKVTGATGYEIRVKVKGKWRKYKTARLSVKIKIKKGLKYKVKVRAISTQSGKTAYGSFSSLKTIKVR